MVSSGHDFVPALPSFLFLLVDDIGWADFSYNNGTALTPNIDRWAGAEGSVALQDFHSGGTVCSPTRATVLTGRNHFRDCVDFVYGCSDMSQCIPDFDFPSETFTVGDAVRTAYPDDYDMGGAYFAGKWHLGSFFNDSEAYGARTSSPLVHGFSKMNATIGVAPTVTLNCQCKAEWLEHCDFGHYNGSNHCYPEGHCCFNYWWDDPMSPHGVTNLTHPTPADDSLYLADAFSRFLAERKLQQKPFLAQISFHNCHIPFIGSKEARDSCARGETCRPPAPGEPPYTDEELDFYACMTELDNAIGIILDAVKTSGYYDNTMTWFTADNGPEMNCPPNGICQRADSAPHRPQEGPGSAGPLRGRKRDIYEGGHRVAGIVSFPAEVKGNAVSWETVVTMDFLPTIMELLSVDRPPEQQSWAFDGRSILPLLRNPQNFRWYETEEGPRSIGIGYHDTKLSISNGWGYRFGRWKLVQGSASCKQEECQKPQLFDLESDLGERHDLATEYPDILADLKLKFQDWYRSILHSRRNESNCTKANQLILPLSLAIDDVDVNYS
jgi:arylsulfatase A-like enzyme